MTDSGIETISPKRFVDQRGSLTFFPHWDLSKIKRSYIIEHPDASIVRAWQGHKREDKWFIVVQCEFKILLVKPDNWTNPSADLKPAVFTLNSSECRVLYVPGGYASGLTAVEPNSRLMVFSNFTTRESKEDDFRFDKHLWYKW